MKCRCGNCLDEAVDGERCSVCIRDRCEVGSEMNDHRLDTRWLIWPSTQAKSKDRARYEERHG